MQPNYEKVIRNRNFWGPAFGMYIAEEKSNKNNLI